MFKELINMELMYSSFFADKLEEENTIEFWDDHLPGMYCHNFVYIKNPMNVTDIINKNLKARKDKGKDFLKIDINFSIENKTIDSLHMKPEISVNDYMWVDTNSYSNLNGNNDCDVKLANSEDLFKDVMEVDILANAPYMGKEFATQRINRKSEIYKDPESNVNVYVCYHRGIPIGCCELMVCGKFAKIEDFDILEEYQRKGFGTSVLKFLLQQSNKLGADIAYLITDSEDTAKKMYEKCGMKKVGEKVELFFKL